MMLTDDLSLRLYGDTAAKQISMAITILEHKRYEKSNILQHHDDEADKTLHIQGYW